MTVKSPVFFKKYDLILITISISSAFYYVINAGWGFPLDDSWIHQTYARNLVAHGEWSLIPGIVSAASTAPFYTLILAAGHLLQINPLFWAHLIGTLALIMTGLFNARLAERLMPDAPNIGLITGSATILAWHLIWAALSGMETMLFTCLVTLLMFLGWRECESHTINLPSIIKRGMMFGLITALASALRPEGAIMAGLIGMGLLVARPHGTLYRIAIWGISASVIFVLGMLPYFLLNLYTSGGFMPNTMAAKHSEFALQLEQSYPVRLVQMLVSTGRGAHFFLLPGVIAYIIIKIRRPSRITLLSLAPALWIIVLSGLYAAYLGTSFQNGRYTMPMIPAFVLCGIVGAAYIMRINWKAQPLYLRVFVRAWVATAGILYLIYLLFLGALTFRGNVALINEELVETAYWIRDHLPDDGLLVVHDIGAIGYFAPRPILDIAGLVSPEVIPIIKDAEKLWPYIEKQGGKYLVVMGEFLPDPNVPNAPLLCPVYRTTGTTAVQHNIAPSVGYIMQWEGGPCEVVSIP